MHRIVMPSFSSLIRAVWLLAGTLVAVACLPFGQPFQALLLVTALAVVCFGLVLARREARSIEARNAQLSHGVELLKTAEVLGGYGRWCIECAPRRHVWSDEMCKLVGLPRLREPDEILLRRFLPKGYQQIELVLHRHVADPKPYMLEFEVTPRGKECRILRAKVQNGFAEDGRRKRVFMVVHDVTAAYRLRRDRDDALQAAAKAQREANTDPLTGLANRRHAMARLDQAVMQARAGGAQLSVIVFDIDRFKTINDAHGHPIGDKVIATVATIARRFVQEGDLIGRIGGEEFLWIKPGCDDRAALQAAERLRWAVEAGTHSAPIPSVTISAGHAVMQPNEAPLMLFARADEALFDAKRAGRNRVAKAA